MSAKVYDVGKTFTKLIEVEVVSKIIIERIFIFYWKRIMCRFRFLHVIISDNGTHFAITFRVDFCHNLEVQAKFISVFHPHENGKKSQTR